MFYFYYLLFALNNNDNLPKDLDKREKEERNSSDLNVDLNAICCILESINFFLRRKQDVREMFYFENRVKEGKRCDTGLLLRLRYQTTLALVKAI